MAAIGGSLLSQTDAAGPQDAEAVTIEDLKSFAKIAGLTFSEADYKEILQSIRANPAKYTSLRKTTTSYDLVPASTFRAKGDDPSRGKIKVETRKPNVKKPVQDVDIAFLTVAELGVLVKSKAITSTELTQIFLARLKKHNPTLNCVVTLCEELALAEAKRADEEIKAGKYRGPLHGIPYGIKDLFAVKGYPTQWGTAAFKGQQIEHDAAVVEKLREAGAVLLAKLSLGALAMNDQWFGGQTKNPWNLKEGSSGSSAGSASAVAGGLCAFAIGTETSGSIVSPSRRCRVTGFRPTFGSISRYGGMCLSYTMDKPGPICRTAEDAALVFAALVGQDSRDPGSIARGFEYKPRKDLKGLTIGVLGNQTTDYTKLLAQAGAKLEEFKLPPAPNGLDLIISVESAAMFDELTRSERFALLTENSWPTTFRGARFVPAVEFVQADRARAVLIEAYAKAFEPFDLVVAADTAGAMIYNSNLTGHPQIFIPMSFENERMTSCSLFAKPFEESKMIAAAAIIQEAKQFHRQRPEMAT